VPVPLPDSPLDAVFDGTSLKGHTS